MQKVKISPFRLSSLIRLEPDPKLALKLFLNPNPDPDPPSNPNVKPKPFRYSLLSYDLIITKLGRAKMIPEMEQIVEQMKRETTRFIPTEIIFCNIINYYARARLPDRALRIYDQIPSFRCRRTVKSFNTLLNGMLYCKRFEKVNELVRDINVYARPDVCTCNILINAAVNFADLESAREVFDEMSKRGVLPNVVTFGTMVNGLCRNGELGEAFKLKEEMVEVFNLRPSVSVYVALIKGLCKVGEVDSAFGLKKEMVENEVKLDSSVYSTLIAALFKAGRRGEVEGLLDEMRLGGCKPDVVYYNSLISGYCNDKDFDSGFGVLKEMVEEGVKPDVVTYNTIIGAYCRQGKLREANDLFEEMPSRECKPDIITYRMLFDGLCGDIQLVEATSILDEMVFKGLYPRDTSVSNFMDKLVEKGEMKLVWKALDTLAKGNLIDVGTWSRVISMVCEQEKLSDTCNSIDTLTLTNINLSSVN
ncbi:hypothetical protein DCAR_0522421 [Daucus carota subsp. sativus]|uniref:Pentacotripeptide-repeat region of PRORP domain-containing protein n=1 Tax=Daucus carota subsp. sativus TaxID=79200 RepID=A0AAF0X7T8_DAUCS|nr:PREDICTED: putative pentatricopeptide repeat-containing protein At1g53330 [Daucus carota subsp. sativus]XP_017248984.1 PREDICTED: putative pentatricopeptide repeat-containing protein At1g53330 [Daucus carota subsp. sativus]XP_017248985.1 PREDICTED: putative pentatricopeptide repeat-containing protein At1g53330 [Daucus carota subsp. sativus]XP_017248986.1 PREDICTED: putative pentatricopeptide repeat-containing protein At1g53330 [Daucus carota subsp. sativus]XP_017248987.1 PREDICTED: putative 